MESPSKPRELFRTGRTALDYALYELADDKYLVVYGNEDPLDFSGLGKSAKEIVRWSFLDTHLISLNQMDAFIRSYFP